MTNLQTVALTLFLIAALMLAGCTHHTVDIKPIKIEPIYAKIDVTIREEVKQDLDQVFDFKDDASSDSPG